MPPRKRPAYRTNSRAALGFEATLWQAADKLRNNMGAAEYKHVALGPASLAPGCAPVPTSPADLSIASTYHCSRVDLPAVHRHTVRILPTGSIGT